MKTKATCIYCGSSANSVDHVPPRCFLEKPFPENLSTVPACIECNNHFSQHEQYAIALLAQIGTSPALAAKIDEGGSVARAFERAPAFEKRFLDRMEADSDGRLFIAAESARLNLVFRKLACGFYYLRYKKRLALNDLGPTGFWSINIKCDVPQEAVMPTYTERFQAKKWTIAQEKVFKYMFAKSGDGHLACIINWHDTFWIMCYVPWPKQDKTRIRRSAPASNQLKFSI